VNEMEKVVENLPAIEVKEGTILINWLGQGGFLLKTPKGKILCIDPYLSNYIEKFEGLGGRRMWFPTFAYSKFKPDVVVCTHDHIDHTDPETLPLIAAYSNAVFMGPTESITHMSRMNIPEDRLREFNREEVYVMDDISIKAVYAKHTKDSIGLIVETAGMKVYITGDTELDEKLYDIAKENIDLLIACINGKWGNMSAREACGLAVKIGTKHAIPMHYGLIPVNTVRPEEFVKLCREEGIETSLLEPEINYRCSKVSNERITIKRH
jgi:L-ascorbate 6-phosphate lactonase